MTPATFHAPITRRLATSKLVVARITLARAWRGCADPDSAAFILTAYQYIDRAVRCDSDYHREVFVARALEALRVGQRDAWRLAAIQDD